MISISTTHIRDFGNLHQCSLDLETTLVSRIIVQVGIKVQLDKISKIDKSAGWNKAMQVGILGNLRL